VRPFAGRPIVIAICRHSGPAVINWLRVMAGTLAFVSLVGEAVAQGPQLPLNTLNEVSAALRTCWIPPPIDQSRAGMQITVRMSFRRNGELFGHPRITFESTGASDDERLAYRIAERCPRERTGGPAVHHPVNRRSQAQTSRECPMMDTENTLTLETTKGKVVILMRPDLAPGHVARIKELVRQGFYDGVVFHRVIDGFMAQTGCPHGTGTGGSGKKLKAEFNKEPHRRGTVSMARAQSPDSGDSQFFICFADAPFLNGKYTVWGQVTEGMANVDKIKRGEPVVEPDRIISAKMGADG